jgi:hypothetical protein
MAYTVPSTKEAYMRTERVPLLVGMILAALGGFLLGRQVSNGGPLPSPPGPTATPSPLRSPMCDAVVRISLDGTVPRANPDRACLAEGRSVTWEIENGDQAEIEIEFQRQDDTDGPFKQEPSTNPHNTERRGKYKRLAGDTRNISSNAADQVGMWEYTVKWTPKNGPPQQLDPVICIRR